MKKYCLALLAECVVVAKIGIVVAVPVCALIFHVWTQYRITQTGYDIAEVTREHRQLLEENRKLSIEATIFGRTDRLATMAREQFGLERVSPNQVVTIDIQAHHDDTAPVILAGADRNGQGVDWK